MTKILIEIDPDGKMCGDCSYRSSFFDGYQVCEIFGDLGDTGIRPDECLNAEATEN